MPFELKPTRKKVPSVYKSLYINERLAEQLDRIAKENETSFNNVVISMIEHCLAEGAEEKTKIETEKTQA
ncbi:MAG TPA: hypothetical protein H9826_09590 [Candidatus Intestinimonas merdavium]|uniref:Arc-like DNA binding domain-containing protein n=1 Tax=Candidatus Intestinimonas merdavium TaxID=2838622 RepID=A0A9D2CFF1_9FIRM|nr:hypothetical protein [Candidatus Intestinimonas merdavium]